MPRVSAEQVVDPGNCTWFNRPIPASRADYTCRFLYYSLYRELVGVDWPLAPAVRFPLDSPRLYVRTHGPDGTGRDRVPLADREQWRMLFPTLVEQLTGRPYVYVTIGSCSGARTAPPPPAG